MSSYLSQFNYQLLGVESGRCWVFLHGLMGYGLNWRKIATGLQDTERILIFDQRGHGKSWKPLTGYAPDDYADDLYLILQELGWDRIILVGHSMGGRNALAFAHKFPEKVERLVIEDMGPEGVASAPDYYRWLLDVVPTPFANKLQAKEFFMNQFKPLVKGRVENPETLGAYFYSNIQEQPDGSADWRFSKQAIIDTVVQGRANDQWDAFRALPMPTLIVRGQDSKELSREIFEKMKLANPRVEGVEIPNAGHWVHSDQSDQFLEVIRKFTGLRS
ncbi:MAG: alpha/beta hydrolase [Bdellovibrio sp. CG10_big_fil_rev_8_21_14_0_10_47_8]|nr:MAG: alpha/beta hydrolase [Bdellovibrio sp. CG10_big_fil_rev_8_21_14_0_10_47_8]